MLECEQEDRSALQTADMLCETRRVQLGPSAKRTLDKVIAVCRRFALSYPPIKPTPASVAEFGAAFDPEFPKEQTIKNQYNDAIVAWRGVFEEKTRLAIERANSKRQDASESNQRDTTSSALLQLYENRLQRKEKEINRLRAILTASTFAPVAIANANELVGRSSSAQVTDLLEVGPVRQWLAQIDRPDSLVRATEIGLEMTQLARPGRILMDRKVLDVLRSM